MSSREMNQSDWIEKHGSGTLRHAEALGCAIRDLYLHERIAFTFGAHFTGVVKTRMLIGPVPAEGDCPAFTEACWNIRRRLSESPAEDSYSGVKYIRVEDSKEVLEGLGLILQHTKNCAWLPEHLTVYCIVAPVKNGKYTGEVRSL